MDLTSAPRSRADQLAIDACAGNIWWNVSHGKTIRASRMRSTVLSEPPSRPPSPSSSATASSTVDATVNEKSLRPVRRSPKLQAHFFHMERALNTCHPREIHEEALKLLTEIKQSSPSSEAAVRVIAEKLFFAGYSYISHSRSFALLAHEIISDLRFSSWSCMQAFEAEIVRLVEASFKLYYNSVRPLSLPCTPPLTILQIDVREAWTDAPSSMSRNRILTLAAFAGDLYAMGILPPAIARSMISSLCSPGQFSFTRCRALYLILLHAKSHTGLSLGIKFMLNTRRRIVWWGSVPPLDQNPFAQQWLIVRSPASLCLLSANYNTVYRRFARHLTRLLSKIRSCQTTTRARCTILLSCTGGTS